MKIAIGNFVRRQIGETVKTGKFGGYTGSEEELLKIINERVDDIKGEIYSMPIDIECLPETEHDKFICTHSIIGPDDLVSIKMEERRKGELPVPVTIVRRHKKDTARSVRIILYSHQALGSDASTDADYEVVSINCSLCDQKYEPMSEDTILRNWFARDPDDPRGFGGTFRKDWTADEVINMIYVARRFWATKARVEIA